jgi:WD40 repeat protein
MDRSQGKTRSVLFLCSVTVLASLGAFWLSVVQAGAPPQAGGAAFTVDLTKRFEINDHRGRLSPDGKTLIVERWDSTGQIRLLDARTGQELHALPKKPRAFDLSPNGRILTGLFSEFRAPYKPPEGQKEFKGEARYYEEMHVWDVANLKAPKRRLVIPDASRPVFSPDGRWLLVSSQEKNQPLHWDLWGLEKGKRLARFPIKTPGEYWPVFSPDGALLAIPDPEAVRLFQVPGEKEVRLLRHKCSRPIYEMSCVLFARGNANTRTVFAPNGKMLATGGDDGKVKLWNVASGELAATLEGHSQSHTFVRYSPDGKRLLTGSIGITEVWRVAPGLPGRPVVKGKARIIDRGAGEVLVWDTQTLAKLHTLPIRCPGSLTWSPDGKILAVGDQSAAAFGKPPALRLWDISGGRVLGSWDGFDDAQFAADGRTLLTWNVGRLVVWDVVVAAVKRGE